MHLRYLWSWYDGLLLCISYLLKVLYFDIPAFWWLWWRALFALDLPYYFDKYECQTNSLLALYYLEHNVNNIKKLQLAKAEFVINLINL